MIDDLKVTLKLRLGQKFHPFLLQHLFNLFAFIAHHNVSENFSNKHDQQELGEETKNGDINSPSYDSSDHSRIVLLDDNDGDLETVIAFWNLVFGIQTVARLMKHGGYQ